MLTIAVALLVAVVGALIYALAGNPKVQTMGLVAFAVGVFWTVYYAGAERLARLL